MSLLGPNYQISLDSANPGSGPVATATVIAPDVRTKTYMSMDNNIRSKVDDNSTPVINLHRQDAQQYVNNKYVNFTDREQINPTVVQQTNLKGNEQWNNLSYNDSDGYRAAKTTTNETTNFSYAGNAEKEDAGGNWWRYTDAPKTTTNETTNFSYAGNAEREDAGGNWWRYADAPKTTINETTNFSYAGDVAPATVYNQSNRTIYTGNGVTSGVTKWSQKALTLVEDYYPGADGHMNIQQNANSKIGKSKFKDDFNNSGNSTIYQAIPDGSKYQQTDKNNIGKITNSHNKYYVIDDRQVENYVVNNLTENPLSIYRETKSNNNKIPTFFVSSNQDKYNSISDGDIKSCELENTNNANTVIAMNKTDKNIENPLLYKQKMPNNEIKYNGKGYSDNIKDSDILFDDNSYNSSRYLHRVK